MTAYNFTLAGITTTAMLWAILTIILRHFPLTTRQYTIVSAVLFIGALSTAVIFDQTELPLDSPTYCNSMVHPHWPWAALLIYPTLTGIACLLLQAYNRIAASLYLLLAGFPLMLFPYWIKLSCAGKTGDEVPLSDIAQSLLFITSFPPLLFFWGGLLTLWLGLSIWRGHTERLPLLIRATALISLFLLLSHHAGRDWLSSLFDR